MSPELLVPSRFGQEKSTPTKEVDIYAMAMVIYQVCAQQCPARMQLIPCLQVLSRALPFGELSGSEAVFKVSGGEKPTEPENALELGLSDKIWKLLEDCWRSDRTLRPSIKGVLGRIRMAASVCGILSSVGRVTRGCYGLRSTFRFPQP